MMMFVTLISCNAQEAVSGGNVNAEEALALIEKGEVSIIDVRTPAEMKSNGYLKGATLINVKSKDFETKIAELPKEETYLVYCHMGGRSAKAMKIMNKLGFEKVYNLKGGITGWKKEGNPTEK
jgi:rhodanese-related sulfurtransferase